MGQNLADYLDNPRYLGSACSCTAIKGFKNHQLCARKTKVASSKQHDVALNVLGDQAEGLV